MLLLIVFLYALREISMDPRLRGDDRCACNDDCGFAMAVCLQ